MSTETSPPTGAAPRADDPAEHRPGRTFTLLMIALTALLFAGMLALLFYKWATNREPTSVIVIEGTPKFEGAEVTVDGVRLNAPYTAKLTADRKFTMPFYLDKGLYTVRVTKDGRTVMEADFEIGTREGKKLLLAKHEHLLDGPTTAPR
jgi:hypothetical protein